MAATAARTRKRKRDALVYAHLENVSRELLERHPDVVKTFIGKNAGVYALYRGSRLYYVGLATALRHRLKAHIKNRHGDSWDSFSVYLTIRDQHLREIEALMLRLAKPVGARQKGRLAQSRDLRRTIAKAVRQKQNREVSELFIQQRVAAAQKKAGVADTYDPALMKLLPNGGRLRGTHKGKTYRCTVRKDGRIRFDGRYFTSLSLAARTAVKRPVNGWWFWQAERGKGNWVRLHQVRRAGTPIYSR